MLINRNWHLPYDPPEEELEEEEHHRRGIGALGGNVHEPKATKKLVYRYPDFFLALQKVGLQMPYLVDSMPPQPKAAICIAKIVIHRYATRVQLLVIFLHCTTIALINDRMGSGAASRR